MELLRELATLQHERGYLDDATLRELSDRRNVPLYRLEGLVSFYPHFRRTPPPRACVRVCRDLGCWMAGSEQLAAELREQFSADESVEIREVSCLGRCDAAPAVSINDLPLRPEILRTAAALAELIRDPARVPPNPCSSQPRQWRCNPYAGPHEHYATTQALRAQGTNIRQFCIERLQASRLRGMGGAGFPTGRKWDLVAQEPRSPKYVICNADESEPGTFKDRVILEELPHLVVEGMLLAGLTIGATQGIVYLRHEYAREQQSLENALADARARGVLGPQAGFDVEIFVSPGGYILGEETALLEALEDKRGEPRNKPPYPGTHGLWGQPTLINNVETFAMAAAIIARGPDWWLAQGLNGAPGLKFVSVSGDVARPGVYEIPLGLPLRDVLALAGGLRDGRPLAAILPGGASSNFLTAASLDVPADFDALQKAGSMLGSGAIVFIAGGTDLFALATNIVRFFRNESCGKCVPCRLGTEQAVRLLQSVHAGETSPDALAILPELGETLQQTSICGLGQVALQPILSLLRQFPECRSGCRSGEPSRTVV